MAEKVFQLIDRLQKAEGAKAPAEKAAENANKALRETKERILRLETERAEADKTARRFGEELRKSRQKEKTAIDKLNEVTKMHRAEKSLRLQEARGRKEQQDARKALAGRVSYLMNKSALDDESRANARVDVKKLEQQLNAALKAKEKVTAALRRSKEANKVLSESMKVKGEELEKLQVDMQMRSWSKEKAAKRTAMDRESARKKSQFGKRAAANGGDSGSGADGHMGEVGEVSKSKGSALSRGSGFKIIKQLPRGREKVSKSNIRDVSCVLHFSFNFIYKPALK